MSSPEVENFEITDEDVYGAFNVRKGRRQTKNQALYGEMSTELAYLLNDTYI